VKTLPETPSVDFLRQEAKDLLTAIRETEPDANLARAQRVLAERYGFGTWADLKAEVERRRAAGAPVAPEIGEELATRFGLGRPAGPLGRVSWSPVAERWALDTDTGRFVARTVVDRVTSESLEISQRLRDAAIEAGVRAPRTVRSTAGNLLEEIDGKRWCVDNWIDVGPTPNVPVSARVAASVGHTLAQFHEVRITTPDPIGSWLTFRRSADEWEQILDAAKASGADWAPLLADAVPVIVELSSLCVDDPADDPQLCINDLSPASVRLMKGDSIAVVHWDFVGTNTPSWELGYVLNIWTRSYDGSVNAVAVRALVDAYAARAGGMPTLDLAMFTPAICAQLNWTVSRIARALDASDLERQRREEPEVRELLTDPPSRATYEEILKIATS
jgi:aminoglycoside phosphotransferase (APT) family kinase protein